MGFPNNQKKTTNDMKDLIRITAQYHENYSDTNTPYWKPKGGTEFELQANSDLFLYVKEDCIKAIKIMLEKASNERSKYTYLDHEIIFGKSEVLCPDTFEKLVQELHE